jgi:hypothetical protein
LLYFLKNHRCSSDHRSGKKIENPNFARAKVKYWEIIADNLSKAGWSWGLRLSD